MKKLFITTFCLFLSIGAFAQIQQGNFQLGGVASYSSLDNGTFESSQYQVIPRLGYFVNEKISLGLQVGFGGRSFGSENAQDSRDEFLVGLYARLHKNLSEKAFLYLEPSFLVGSGNGTMPTVNGTADIENSSFNFGITPGIIYFITDKIGLELGVGLFQYREENIEEGGTTSKTENLIFSFNPLQVNTGISMYF